MPRHPEPAPATQDEIELVRMARLLHSLSSPESLQTLRRLAQGSQSALTIAVSEGLTADAVEIYLERFATAGVIQRTAKQWWELTRLGREAARSIGTLSYIAGL